MDDDEPSVHRSRRKRYDAAIASLVLVTVAVLSGASALTIYRLHLLRPNQPLSTTVSLALPLLAYAAVAGVLVVLLGHLATSRIERERKEAERLKSDFVSFASHQLRTPVAGMSWMLELAAEAEGLPQQARDYIGEARQSAARLSTLVNHLLDIARLESGRTVLERRPVDLADLTKSVVGEMQAVVVDKRQTLNVEAPNTPPVTGDPQMLRRVIANLMSNAVKYTPDGGRIDVRLARQAGTVEWLVHDTGIGIPRAARDRLFEKFFRAENALSKEAEGSGLGLHLARLIIEQTGGHMRVESEEGQGTTFAFVLPVWQQAGDEGWP